MPTDTSERGLETLIVNSLLGQKVGGGGVFETPDLAYDADYVVGDPHDYDREHAVDAAKLFAFLQATQPDAVDLLQIGEPGTSRTAFLHRLQGEIARRGIIDVLRKGIKHQAATVQFFYGTPTPGNHEAFTCYWQNSFSVTRQLRYSKSETALALDIVLFINGLPIATFELKNSLTKQTVADAVLQYKRDRDPKELLFQKGRCAVHFALDEQEVRFCTELRGNDSWFLPFNKGFNDGAGNPPNPDGIMTDYLWKQILRRDSLTDIIENYASSSSAKQNRAKRSVTSFSPAITSSMSSASCSPMPPRMARASAT